MVGILLTCFARILTRRPRERLQRQRIRPHLPGCFVRTRRIERPSDSTLDGPSPLRLVPGRRRLLYRRQEKPDFALHVRPELRGGLALHLPPAFAGVGSANVVTQFLEVGDNRRPQTPCRLLGEGHPLLVGVLAELSEHPGGNMENGFHSVNQFRLICHQTANP